MDTESLHLSRSLRSVACVVALLLLAGCATTPSQPEAGPALLGAGREVLHTQCNVCHALSEVAKFQGFYDRDQWRRVVLTMMSYGAAMTQNDLNALVVYLAETDEVLDD